MYQIQCIKSYIYIYIYIATKSINKHHKLENSIMTFTKSNVFLLTLSKLPINRRAPFLKLCQTFVIDDLNELLSRLNLIDLTKFDRNIITNILYSKSLRKKRNLILNQNGSFITRILPYILGKSFSYLLLFN